MKKAVLKQANTGGHTEREVVEALLNYGGRGGACSNWRNSLAIVSRSQTAIFSFILGQEKIGSGTPPIEKAVLASTAIGVGDYWQWLLCNR